MGRSLPQDSTALTGKRAWGALALFGAAASLAACQLPQQAAGFHAAAVDPASPVYKDVMEASRHPGPYPKFSDIPEIPADVRPAPAWAVAVADVKADKARLENGVAALPAPPADTDAFAAASRDQAHAPDVQAPSDETAAQSQAYAQSLRARATPPPKRRAHKR